MKKSLKLVIVLGMIMALVGFFNMNAIAAWFSSLSALPNFVTYLAAVILLIFPGFPLIVYFYHKLNISLFRKGLSDGNGKMLSYKTLKKLAMEFAEDEWKLALRGRNLVLVNHYFTPDRDDAKPYAYFQFTSDQAFMDHRIKKESIPPEKLFPVVLHMNTGQPVINLDSFNDEKVDENIKRVDMYWFKGIKQKEEMPFMQDLKKHVLEGMGFELGKGMLEKKDKKEEENNGKKTD